MSRDTPARVDLLQGTLDLLILRTLLTGPEHGHAIAGHIRRTSEELLKVETGSLYPALHRLRPEATGRRAIEVGGAVARDRADSEPCRSGGAVKTFFRKLGWLTRRSA